jgi:hypothetical protein
VALELYNSLVRTVFTYQPGGWLQSISKDGNSYLMDFSVQMLLVLLDEPEMATALNTAEVTLRYVRSIL